MGNLGDMVPPGEDAELRQQRDTERRQQEEAAARRLARSQIGDGGVLKIDGTLQVTGDLEVPSGALSSAGNMTAGVDVVAGRDVLAGRHVDVTGDLDVAGTTTLGIVNSPATYNRNVTGSGSYRVRYVNILGEEGYVPSSRRVKQDIVEIQIDAATVRQIRTYAFRYILAVETLGDDAPIEIGSMAEDVHDLGLTWLVDYDENGDPAGLKYERLSLALLCVVHDDDARLSRIEQMLGIDQAQTA